MTNENRQMVLLMDIPWCENTSKLGTMLCEISVTLEHFLSALSIKALTVGAIGVSDLADVITLI